MKKKVFTKWIIGVLALFIAVIQPAGVLLTFPCPGTVATAEAAVSTKPGKVFDL